MADTIITLAKPITGHGGEIKRIVLREPTFEEYLDIGDPYEVGESREGTLFTVQSPEVIRAYIEKCVVEPADPLILYQAPARVAKKVRRAILDFFQDDVAEGAGSKTSPTS